MAQYTFFTNPMSRGQIARCTRRGPITLRC